ncbi:MAG TPA: OmpA family protein [Polyangiaceae bacterium]
MHFGKAASVAAAAVALVACGGSKPPVAAPPASLANAGGPAQGSTQSPTASNVSISDEIRTKCGISDADAYFSFDSAHLTSKDHSPLELVAKCFTHGPLAGRSVKLVGRADSRGDSDYNITLGQSRADAVGVYLDARGMSKAKTQSTSRGSMDASGTDESGWQHDRRVDVMLGD